MFLFIFFSFLFVSRWRSVKKTHFRIWPAETSQTIWLKPMLRLLARGNTHLTFYYHLPRVYFSNIHSYSNVNNSNKQLNHSFSSDSLKNKIWVNEFRYIIRHKPSWDNWYINTIELTASLLCPSLKLTKIIMTFTDMVASHWVPGVLSFCPTEMKLMMQSLSWGDAFVWTE